MQTSYATFFDKIVALLDRLQECYASDEGNSRLRFGEWILASYYPETNDPALSSETDPHKVRALVLQRWVHGRLNIDALVDPPDSARLII
jgi:hypothetical protein